MKSQRSAAFDAAKGLAMYLVVLGHLVADRMGDPAHLINLVHLPVLFFISGFFSAASVEKRSPGALLKRKAATLLIPYLIWSGVSLAANCALSALRGGVSLQSVLQEGVQILVYARSVWFLLQLFVVFAVFLAVYKLLERTGWRKGGVFVYLGVWLGLSLLIPGAPFAFQKFKWLFPFFLLGYFVAVGKDRLAAWLGGHKKLAALGWLSLLYPVLVAVLARDALVAQYTAFAYNSLTGVLGGLLLYGVSAVGVVLVLMLAFSLEKTFAGRALAQVGTYSMDIYVIHMFLIKFIPIPVALNTVHPIVAWCLLGVITAGIVAGIWLVSHFVLRKIKLYRISIGMK